MRDRESSAKPAWGRMAKCVQVALSAAVILFATGLYCGAQTYLYNQASFTTGESPQAVVAADFNGDGDLDLAVADNGGNGVSILLANSDGSFAPQVFYPTGQSPSALVAADFNHDGKMDLAVANQNSFTISILLGNGDGTFTLGATISVSSDPQALVAGDWNGDGKVDLAATILSGNVAVFLGNGDGTFAPEVDYSVGGGWIAVADFNGDGKPDFATVNGNNHTISILFGNGDGTFAPSVSYPFRSGTTTSVDYVLAADFNGDHNADLAVVDSYNSTVSILFGNGDGTFQAPINYPVGFNPASGAVVDLNRDGMPDLVVANTNDGTVSVLLNKGTGAFQNHVDYGTAGADFVAVGDFNRDGLPDVAVTNDSYSAGKVTVLLGNPDGTLARSSAYPTISSGSLQGMGLAVADLRGNGKLDLITSDPGWATLTAGTINVLLGNGDGTFQSPSPLSGGGGHMAVADFNGDGIPDLALPGQQNFPLGTSVAIFLGRGDGTFQTGPSFTTGTGPFSVAAGDFNNDGKMDLAVADYGGASVSVLLGNGDGTFQTHTDYAVGIDPSAVAIGDFNGDGKPDMAVANRYDGTISVLLGNGDGTFQKAVTYSVGGSPAGIAAGDLNGDGKLDLAVANGTVSVLLGNGDGTFQPHLDSPANGTTAIAVGDFNGDGVPDVATANQTGSTFSVLIGHGDGTFASGVSFWAGSNSLPNSIVAADFNADGNEDVAVAGQAGIVIVLLNEPAMAISSPGLDFGSQSLGTASSSLPIVITNAGATGLNIAGVSAGGDFAETDDCAGTLAVGSHCTVNVTFTPGQTGTASGTLTLTDDNSGVAGSVQTVALMGTGVGPTADLSSASLAFGDQGVSTTSPAKTLTLSNGGSAPLAISSIAVSGDFAQTNTCGSSVAVGANCTISITFAPAAAGSRTGTLTITDNATTSPQTVALSGTGQDFTLGELTTSQSVTPGGTASFQLQVGSQGGFAGAVALSCSGAPTNSTCTVTPSSVTLDGTNPQNVSLSVATTAPSAAIPVAPEGPAIPPAALWLAALAFLALAAMSLWHGRPARGISRPGWPSHKRRIPTACRAARILTPDFWPPASRSRLRPVTRHLSLVTALALLLFVALAASCGGGAAPATHTPTGGTAPGTYTLTVTATSGSLSHSSNVTLTVQ